MSRVTQTILHDPGSPIPGNCYQAAVASVLDLPLAQVPHLMLFTWWHGAAEFWARGIGKTIHTGKTVDEIPPGVDAVVSGPSPRGVSHAIVRWADGTEWDPHPSRAGLLEVRDVQWFEPWAGVVGCPVCGAQDWKPRLGHDCAARFDGGAS